MWIRAACDLSGEGGAVGGQDSRVAVSLLLHARCHVVGVQLEQLFGREPPGPEHKRSQKHQLEATSIAARISKELTPQSRHSCTQSRRRADAGQMQEGERGGNPSPSKSSDANLSSHTIVDICCVSAGAQHIAGA